MINFFEARCKDQTSRKLFGLCDDQSGERAYLDEKHGEKWIAVVVNEESRDIIFVAIDHCIEIKREDGKMDKRCDGFLAYNSTLIFVELKERSSLGSDWVKEGEKQLKSSISHFENLENAKNYCNKKAYIANKEHHKSKVSQANRMNQFLLDTGYVLRIENRIILD
jgi:hypothetical protein